MDKPKRLFKYQPVSQYSLRNLKNSHIYFNHPYDFNDPFDTSHEVRVRKVEKGVAKDIYFRQGTNRLLFEKIEEKIANREDISLVLTLFFKEIKDFKIKFIKILNLDENDFLNKSPEDILNEFNANNNNNNINDLIVETFYSSFNKNMFGNLVSP